MIQDGVGPESSDGVLIKEKQKEVGRWEEKTEERWCEDEGRDRYDAAPS